MANRYQSNDLTLYIEALFVAAGMDADKSAIVAPLLVEADLMGHTTHGIAQAPAYLSGLENGLMKGTGDPLVVADRGATITWDGQRISGVWLTAKWYLRASSQTKSLESGNSSRAFSSSAK